MESKHWREIGHNQKHKATEQQEYCQTNPRASQPQNISKSNIQNYPRQIQIHAFTNDQYSNINKHPNIFCTERRKQPKDQFDSFQMQQMNRSSRQKFIVYLSSGLSNNIFCYCNHMGNCCDQLSPQERRAHVISHPQCPQADEQESQPAFQKTTVTTASADKLRLKFLQLEKEKKDLIQCLQNDIQRKQSRLSEMEAAEGSLEKEKLKRQIEFNQRLVKQSQDELAKIQARMTKL